MLTIAVRGLPRSTTEDEVESLFEAHGRVHDMHMPRDIFSGHCKGIARLRMEGHEAREAVDQLDGKVVAGSHLKVHIPRKKRTPRYRSGM